MIDLDARSLTAQRELLPARAKRNIKATVNSRAPLLTLYVCEIELDGRVVAAGGAVDPSSAERYAISAYLALTAAFGQPNGVR